MTSADRAAKADSRSASSSGSDQFADANNTSLQDINNTSLQNADNMADEIRDLSRRLNEAIGLINTQTQRLQSQQDTLTVQAQRIAELENQNVQQDQAPPEHVPSGSIKPTFFRGGFHPTFTEWLEAYEEIAVCNNWKEEQKLNNLAYYLKDGAKTALK